MQVETDKAVEAAVDNIISDLQTTAASQGVSVQFSRSGQDITAKFAEALEDKVETFVKKTYAVLVLKDRSKGQLVYGLQPARANEMKEDAVRQAKERTERRINKFGVAEPNVYKRGVDQLVIQLPGIKNPQEAISFMKTAGRLEFKLVDTESDMQKALAGKVPEGREILYSEGVGETGKVTRQPYLLFTQTLLTGDRLKEAKVSIDEYGKPAISITFDGDGARVFEGSPAKTSASSWPSSSMASSIPRRGSRTVFPGAAPRSRATSRMTRRRSSPSFSGSRCPRL
jgi:preprotein translocase subunit SecD